MVNYDGLEVVEEFDKENSWTVLTFYKEDEEIGFMNIDKPNRFHSNETFIYTMNSYEQNEGNGTKMINFLANVWYLEKISGDATVVSRGFWNKFNPSWNGNSFEIVL